MSSDRPGAGGGPPTGVGFYFNADDSWNVTPAPQEWIEIAPRAAAPEPPQRRRLTGGRIALVLALAAAASMALVWSLTPHGRPAPLPDLSEAAVAPQPATPQPAPSTPVQSTPATPALAAPSPPARTVPTTPAKAAAATAAKPERKPAPHRAKPSDRRRVHATHRARRSRHAAKHPPASRKASRPAPPKPAAPEREPARTAPPGFPYATSNPG